MENEYKRNRCRVLICALDADHAGLAAEWAEYLVILQMNTAVQI